VVRVIPAFAPDRLILYQSTLTPGGARYDTLGAWTFPVTVNETPDA
jgi:2'-5' RNA ligase